MSPANQGDRQLHIQRCSIRFRSGGRSRHAEFGRELQARTIRHLEGERLELYLPSLAALLNDPAANLHWVQLVGLNVKPLRFLRDTDVLDVQGIPSMMCGIGSEAAGSTETCAVSWLM